MAATMKQVADLAGVSVRTVSNVVNDFDHVAPTTRKRVQEAINSLGYQPNTAARSLRTGRTGLIALVVPALDQPYFAEMARAVVTHATDAGYTVVLDQTDGDRARELDILSHQPSRSMFDGLIMNPLTLTAADIPATSAKPMILLGERAVTPAVDHIHIDNVAAARTATEHLVTTGRRRVAAIGMQNIPSGQTARQRAEGMMVALAEAELPAHPGLFQPAAEFTRRHGYWAMRELLAGALPFDAVFCFNDMLAIGAMKALHERGVRVPDDIAVVGFDGVEESEFCEPGLTTIQPDKGAIARTAVDRLLSRLGGDTTSRQEILIGYELIVRESSGGRAMEHPCA